jgi:hypothetical protein
MKVRDLMLCANLSEHSNDDAEESTQFRHRPILHRAGEAGQYCVVRTTTCCGMAGGHQRPGPAKIPGTSKARISQTRKPCASSDRRVLVSFGKVHCPLPVIRCPIQGTSARAVRPLGCPASRSGDPDQCGKMPHFFAFLMCATFLGIETSDSKGEEKQSHLSHLSPLSHFQVLQWLFG